MGKQPDYTLNALNKETGAKSKIGVGWNNTDGSVTVKFDPFVAILPEMDLAVRLFPARREQNAGEYPATRDLDFREDPDAPGISAAKLAPVFEGKLKPRPENEDEIPF